MEKRENAIDVRGFIQENYTPYEGGPEFLSGPTARTKALMEKVNALLKAESDKGGVITSSYFSFFLFTYLFR